MDFYGRLRAAQRTSGDCNCLGTALYLLGLAPADTYVSIYDEGMWSPSLSPILFMRPPPLHALVLIRQRTGLFPGGGPLVHAGVITSLEPLLMLSRLGRGGHLEEGTLDEYMDEESVCEFRRPRAGRTLVLPLADMDGAHRSRAYSVLFSKM